MFDCPPKAGEPLVADAPLGAPALPLLPAAPPFAGRSTEFSAELQAMTKHVRAMSARSKTLMNNPWLGEQVHGRAIGTASRQPFFECNPGVARAFALGSPANATRRSFFGEQSPLSRQHSGEQRGSRPNRRLQAMSLASRPAAHDGGAKRRGEVAPGAKLIGPTRAEFVRNFAQTQFTVQSRARSDSTRRCSLRP